MPMNKRSDDPIAAAKRALRARLRDELQAMDAGERADASARACSRVISMPAFASACSIMAYLPLPGEADSTPLIERALRERKNVCVPHVDWESRAMQAARVASLDSDQFKVDRHGVRVPRVIETVAIESIALVIVPGLAFDERCRRLGRGGGFYDRFLARLPATIPTIGLAFERQVVPELPCALHDAGVHMVATEKRLLQPP